jgi:hypothetical protein
MTENVVADALYLARSDFVLLLRVFSYHPQAAVHVLQ